VVKRLAQVIVASAVYGFSIGSVHSTRLGVYNLLKFPLLILVTSAVCAMAFYVFSQFITRELSFRDVQSLTVSAYRDVTLLLASLSPVSFFLAKTILQPDQVSLREYPFFKGLTVIFIALCGGAALTRQTVLLLRRHSLSVRKSVLIVVTWLSLSLFAGGQCAWYLRPFFGIATPGTKISFFIAGTRPDSTGATNFYQSVYNMFNPPPPGKDHPEKAGRRTDEFRTR